MMRFGFAITLAALAALGNTAQAAPTSVTFVTDWKAQAEHGGFYEAVAHGALQEARPRRAHSWKVARA
jgi:hypothetical protein